ncbi:hypothetical protein FRB95_002858 [Tulasnella sp. JGI-2019a]|nr:hypothetical protein FRB95_002858 [Tulasnella sp. JGI-2019a]
MGIKLSSPVVGGLVDVALDNGTSHLNVCKLLKELEARDDAMIGSGAVSNGEKASMSPTVPLGLAGLQRQKSKIMLTNAALRGRAEDDKVNIG